MFLEGNVLYRNFYNDTGKELLKHFCVPKHFWKETIYRLHNSNSRTRRHQSNNFATKQQQFRKRFFYPGFTKHFISFIKNCLTRLQLNRVPKNHITPKITHFKYVLSGIDVFTKYLSAVSLANGYADIVARELVKVFFQHNYNPKRILSDLGTNFKWELMSELASILEVKYKHASLKHMQTIGAAERLHGPLQRILKLNTEEQWKDWHNYVPLSTFIHNT